LHPGLLAVVEALNGNKAETRKIFDKLRTQKDPYVPPYTLASIEVALGDNDRALEYLKQAYEANSIFITFLKTDPDFDPLRNAPEFKRIEHELGVDK
jgi:hypothetical protein